MRKLDEYRVSGMLNGEWIVDLDPHARVLVYESLEAALQAIGRVLPRDHPTATRIVLTIEGEGDGPGGRLKILSHHDPMPARPALYTGCSRSRRRIVFRKGAPFVRRWRIFRTVASGRSDRVVDTTR